MARAHVCGYYDITSLWCDTWTSSDERYTVSGCWSSNDIPSGWKATDGDPNTYYLVHQDLTGDSRSKSSICGRSDGNFCLEGYTPSDGVCTAPNEAGSDSGQFVTIDPSEGHATCEDAGYVSLDKDQCAAYLALVGGGTIFGSDGSPYNTAYHPSACTIRANDNNMWWNANPNSTTTCDTVSDAYDCVCWNAGGAAPNEVTGCTDPLACNYDGRSTTVTDNSLCAYKDEVCETCSGEQDGTGSIVDNDSDDDGVCDADDACPGADDNNAEQFINAQCCNC